MAQHLQSHAITVQTSAAYQSLFELGHGGMGAVFVARSLGAGGFQRLVLLKRLHPHLTERADAVRRFLDEGRLAAHVRHSNVAGTLQVGSDEEGYFLVLDYIEGANLENLLDYSALRRLPLDPSIVLRIALDVCAGLQAIHEAEDPEGRPLKILHRDVSLQNVLVGRDGVTRIADFGVAKSVFASVSTDKSYVVGKLLYLPPEYLLRENTGPSLDVYSLGMTLWLTLSGQEPWPGASEAQLVRNIVGGEVPPLSTVVTVSARIEQIVARACRRKPDERYQSAREMAADIEVIAREPGRVATHAEVAACVEALAGADLRRRRELIAAALARAQYGAPVQSNVSPPVDSAPTPAKAIAAPSVRPYAVALILGVVSAAMLGGWLWQNSGSRVRDIPAPSASAAVPATTRAAQPAKLDATPVVLPAVESAAGAQPIFQPRPQARPGTLKPPAPSAPISPRPPPAGEPLRGPRVPDDIARKNPYR